MKVGFLSVCIILCALYGTESSAYFSEKKSQKVMAPPLTLITSRTESLKEDKKPGYIVKRGSLMDDKSFVEYIEHGSLWDGRSFAAVVKGEKKPNLLKDKKKSKKEKKSKKRFEKFLQPKISYEQQAYDTRKSQQNEAGEFSKRYQAAINKGNKKHQSAHKGKLYRSR